MTKKSFATWLIALACLVSFAAFAAEPNPSGTVSISSKSVAIGVGVSWGDGTLTYGGKTYTTLRVKRASPSPAVKTT